MSDEAEKSERDERMFNELYTRMRETEAQTREQCVQIKNLCERIDNFTTVTDKFFELEEKRHLSDEKRIMELFELERQREEKTEKREAMFWKVITILIGTVIALALGPKVAREILTKGGQETPAVVSTDVWYQHDPRTLYMLPTKQDPVTV